MGSCPSENCLCEELSWWGFAVVGNYPKAKGVIILVGVFLVGNGQGGSCPDMGRENGWPVQIYRPPFFNEIRFYNQLLKF